MTDALNDPGIQTFINVSDSLFQRPRAAQLTALLPSRGPGLDQEGG